MEARAESGGHDRESAPERDTKICRRRLGVEEGRDNSVIFNAESKNSQIFPYKLHNR